MALGVGRGDAVTRWGSTATALADHYREQRDAANREAARLKVEVARLKAEVEDRDETIARLRADLAVATR